MRAGSSFAFLRQGQANQPTSHENLGELKDCVLGILCRNIERVCIGARDLHKIRLSIDLFPVKNALFVQLQMHLADYWTAGRFALPVFTLDRAAVDSDMSQVVAIPVHMFQVYRNGAKRISFIGSGFGWDFPWGTKETQE